MSKYVYRTTQTAFWRRACFAAYPFAFAAFVGRALDLCMGVEVDLY